MELETKELPMISIVVVVFDNPRMMMKSIETLRDNTDYFKPLKEAPNILPVLNVKESNFEIIISNNSKGLPVEQEIDNLAADYVGGIGRIKHQKNPKNLYHGKGSMAGFELHDPKSKYVCFCNEDIFIPASQSNWLHKLVSFLEERPNVATVTPALYSAKEQVYWLGKQDPKQAYHDYLHFPRGDLRLPVVPVVTCYNNMAVCLTRVALAEEFPLGQSCPHYGSDSEFANRIADKYPDMEHWVIPAVQLYHYNIFSKRVTHGKDKVVDG